MDQTNIESPNNDDRNTVKEQTRVQLPLIQGDGTIVINPTPEELDDSLWDLPRLDANLLTRIEQ